MTILDRLMSGYSHGAAGIANALLRLSALDGDASLRDLAREAIAYEDGLFDETHGNWPDMRHVGEFWNASLVSRRAGHRPRTSRWARVARRRARARTSIAASR